MTTSSPRRGRPPGSTTQPKPQCDVTLSRCRCGCTERTPYTNPLEKPIAGVDAATGLPYTHIIWRHTKCLACGQARVDRTLENRASRRAG